MKRHYIKSLLIFSVLSVILINYQNCGSSAGAGSGAAQLADGNMDIIDQVNPGSINFTQNKAVVSQSDEQLSVYGTCSVEQSGAYISWKLFDNNDNLLFKGKALCDKGAFEVSFDGVQDLACNSQLHLEAYFGSQAQTSISIDKNCQ